MKNTVPHRKMENIPESFKVGELAEHSAVGCFHPDWWAVFIKISQGLLPSCSVKRAAVAFVATETKMQVNTDQFWILPNISFL